MRGHGQSTNPASTFRHDAAAGDILALLDRLDVTAFKALGVSAGGNVLLHLATQHPGRVQAMVLVSATTHFPAQIDLLFAQARAFADSYDGLNFTASDLAKMTAIRSILWWSRRRWWQCRMRSYGRSAGSAGRGVLLGGRDLSHAGLQPRWASIYRGGAPLTKRGSGAVGLVVPVLLTGASWPEKTACGGNANGVPETSRSVPGIVNESIANGLSVAISYKTSTAPLATGKDVLPALMTGCPPTIKYASELRLLLT